jgi:hypothetical protein
MQPPDGIIDRRVALGEEYLLRLDTPAILARLDQTGVAAIHCMPDRTITSGQTNRADHTLAAQELVRDLPNLYACACGPKPADIHHLVRTAGTHKVLFGCDGGLSDWMIVGDRLDSARYPGLSDADLRQVLYGATADLLHLVSEV